MRLLILTQKMDINDPILGFFHNWVQKLASNFEKIWVVCLEKGKYHLPQNVEVFSLGKENKKSRFFYLVKFFNLCLFQSLNYDSVFVHMNQEYVLLGGIFWKFLGKKIYFWRNHPKGNVLTRTAVFLSEKIFYTSPESYTARFKNAEIMPVGIDTEKFKPGISNLRIKNSILSLGRISPIKNIEGMIKAVEILKQKGVGVKLDIVGDPVNKEDFSYLEQLKVAAGRLADSETIKFLSAVPNDKTPDLYRQHQLFLNLTPTGSFDKSILEAVACGCLPIVANQSLDSVFDELKTLTQPEQIADKISQWLNTESKIDSKKTEELQKYVLLNHSLSALIDQLVAQIK